VCDRVLRGNSVNHYLPPNEDKKKSYWSRHRTKKCSSLRHCATSRKIAISIPDEVKIFANWQEFHPHNGPEIDSASNRNKSLSTVKWNWHLDRHLWADCIDHVGSSTSHGHMDFHGLVQVHPYLLSVNIVYRALTDSNIKKKVDHRRMESSGMLRRVFRRS
jgi:hypothetical protein